MKENMETTSFTVLGFKWIRKWKMTLNPGYIRGVIGVLFIHDANPESGDPFGIL